VQQVRALEPAISEARPEAAAAFDQRDLRGAVSTLPQELSGDSGAAETGSDNGNTPAFHPPSRVRPAKRRCRICDPRERPSVQVISRPRSMQTRISRRPVWDFACLGPFAEAPNCSLDANGRTGPRGLRDLRRLTNDIPDRERVGGFLRALRLRPA